MKYAPPLLAGFLCLLAGAAGGCSGAGPESSPSETGRLLETSEGSYAARVHTDGRERVVVDVPYAIHNTTPDTLVLTGCRHPAAPSLEKRVGGRWETAWSAIELLCLSPPWKIAPGDVRRSTLHVTGYRPGQNAGPAFETSVAGVYRLNQHIFARVGEKGTGEGLLPVAQRVSNTFELARATR